jgi:hypothetical protein
MAQKFQRGFRVEILSRQIEDPNAWENTGVGKEAIVEYSNEERPHEYDSFDGYTPPAYRLLILHDGHTPISMQWFEERFLELICCNDAKGKKILADNGR